MTTGLQGFVTDPLWASVKKCADIESTNLWFACFLVYTLLWLIFKLWGWPPFSSK